MSIKKWRLRCLSETAVKYWYLDSADPDPTTCPTDTAHSVDLSTLVMEEEIGALTPVERRISVGKNESVMEGGFDSFQADEWGWVEYTLPEDLHMHGALVCWDSWQLGDRGYSGIANPLGMDVLANQASSGQALVDLGAGKEMLAAAYDPAIVGGRVWVEFWRTDEVAPPNTQRIKNPGLVELQEVDSVAGAVITLKQNLANTHASVVNDTILIPLYGTYSSPSGPDGLQNVGISLLGSGFERLGSPDRSEATRKLSAGLCVCLRVKATSDVATRKLTASFDLRRPD